MKQKNTYYPCTIWVRAFNMTHENKIHTKHPMTMRNAKDYVMKKYGETGSVIKIKVGLQIIYNQDYTPFRIELNQSTQYLRK